MGSHRQSWKNSGASASVGQVISRRNRVKSFNLILKEWCPQGAILFFLLHCMMLPQTFKPTQSPESGPPVAAQLQCRTTGLGPGAAFCSLSPAASDSCLSGVATKLPFHGRPAVAKCFQSTFLPRPSSSLVWALCLGPCAS